MNDTLEWKAEPCGDPQFPDTVFYSADCPDVVDGEDYLRQYHINDGKDSGGIPYTILALRIWGEDEVTEARPANLDAAKALAERWQTMRLVKTFVPFSGLMTTDDPDEPTGYNKWSLMATETTEAKITWRKHSQTVHISTDPDRRFGIFWSDDEYTLGETDKPGEKFKHAGVYPSFNEAKLAAEARL